MKKITISIIVPVYNVAPYVERCLSSVIQQTYDGEMECIVVDDCGTDNSIEVVQKFISEYVGPISFKIIHHSHNRGLSAARNTGIEAASCDYIFFLDSDDALPLDSLERLAKPLQNERTIDMVMGNRLFALAPSASPLVQLETDLVSLETVRGYLLTHGFSIAAWNKLTNKNFLLENRLYFKEGILHEDLLWTHYVMKYLRHLYILSDVTYLVYGHPDSITQAQGRSEERAQHKGLIYEEIAMNLTKGEEVVEAEHYFPGFCVLFCHYPQIPSIQRAASLLRRNLSDGHHIKEHLLLSSILVLSNYALGRRIITIALTLRVMLKRAKSTKR